VIFAAALAACSDSGGPVTDDVRPPGDLTIIRLPAGSAPIWNPVDSFYAKKGEDREVRIYFSNSDGTGPGEEYMRLRVDAGSLDKRPDGTVVQVGDSIRITVQVQDPALVQFEFQPAGLTFNPNLPAQIRIDYGETGGDLNDDGAVDAEDASVEQIMGLWRQEQPGQTYLKLGSVKLEELDEIEADVLGFTRYAIAY
jgi:hypothetical protein